MPADLHGLATVSLRSSYEFDPAVAVPVVASRGDLGTAAVISPASESRPTTGPPKVPSAGQMQLPFAFDCRLNQIPDDWHQIAVRFRRVNGIRDGDRERSI